MYRLWPVFWGVIFIGIGALFLAQQLSNGTFDAGEFIGRWWPLILVLLGLLIVVEAFAQRSWWSARGRGWGGPSRGGWAGPWAGTWGPSGPSQQLSLDVGGAASATVEVAFGAGEIVLNRAAAGKLVDGTFDGGVRPESGGPGRVRLSRDASYWGWGPGRWAHTWRFGVTGDVPLALKVETGASRNDLDLSDLRVTDLAVRTGAAETIVRLPRNAGLTRARIEAGAASVRVFVPDGVALRITGRMQIGTNDVDTRRFPPTPTGWSSPDFDTAANRTELFVSGGLASLQVA